MRQVGAALGAHGDSGWALASTSDAVFGVSNEGGECTSWPPPDCPSPAPSRGGGECYAFGLNATSGEELWKARTGAPGGGGVVVEDAARGLSLFVAGSWAGVVVAYDMHSGKQVWSFRAGGEVESHPAYYGGVVFASAEESRTLFAINATTGKELWRYNGAAQEINSSPSVSLDTVFVGANDHYMHAVSRTTGAFKWKVRTCANVFASAAIADDGMVYIACNTETGPTWGRGVGAVYAIDPASPHNVTVPVPERKVAVAT